MLADVGLRYFLTDGHGILYARPRPRFGSYAPIFTETGVAVLVRDHESSQQVWSSELPPSAPEYQEFTKTWVGKQNMSTSSLISCPMVSEKHRY